jgi:hypothetical protein
LYQNGHFELFNIKNDPGEQHNLMATMPEEFAKMKKELLAWRKSMGIEVRLPDTK